MHKSIAVVTIAACAALSGCNHADEDGGATVSRNYQVGNFEKIEVAGPYEVQGAHRAPISSVSAQRIAEAARENAPTSR